MSECTRGVFVSPGARELYSERYPSDDEKFSIISNGFDELSFRDAMASVPKRPASSDRLTLLHSGVLYATPDRDPSAFFEALSSLHSLGAIGPENLRVVLRSSGQENRYSRQIREHGLQGIVSLEPPLPYREALAEMLRSDGLLLCQGYPSNPAIPAKVYEYIRAQRPIFAMVHSDGDTAKLLRELQLGLIVPLDSAEQIRNGLLRFIAQVRSRTASVLNSGEVNQHSRLRRTEELSRLLDTL